MTIIHNAVLLATLTMLTACSAEQSARQVSLRSLHQSAYCGGEAAGLRWLAREHLADLLGNTGTGQDLRGQHLAERHLDAAPASVPSIADDEKLVLVSLGQKNSGGYGVALASHQTGIRDGVIDLPLDIQQPAPGTMQTMQLTTPCLVIGLHGEGFSRVNAGSLGSVTVND